MLQSAFVQGSRRKPSRWDAFIPKSIVCLREGYGRQFFFNDLMAGITVAIIALPLSLALAIGSGVSPERGLYTAIFGGFVISLLGGSRVQIGGPAGAFMAIVAGIVAKYGGGEQGYQALAICTLMAGIILIAMGIAKLGSLIKFIPYPVTTGFTSGIAVIIFTSQVKDFLGLSVPSPTGFVEKWSHILAGIGQTNLLATGFGAGSLAVMILFRRFFPRIPSAIIVVVGAAMLTHTLALDTAHYPAGMETIGTRFKQIPNSLPAPHLPVRIESFADAKAALNTARNLIPEAFTIAILCAIESLLCAVVADGMIGGRHKSNCELVAQGCGNLASIFFGGIAASGVIARTAANVKNGGRTPLAGMVHSITLLIMMLLLAPYAVHIPLSVLAAVLILVAWNMAEIDHFRSLLSAPRSDILVLVATFGLTVLTDLTVAVGVGMVLASMLFMKRMSEVTNVGAIIQEMDETQSEGEFPDLTDPNSIMRRDVPPGVEVYEINGPFFFGVADRLKDTLGQLERPAKVFILRMRHVSAVDATGMHALEEFHHKCRRQGTRLLLAGVHAQPIFAMTKYGMLDKIGEENMYGNIDDALNAARGHLGLPPTTRPPEALPEVARER